MIRGPLTGVPQVKIFNLSIITINTGTFPSNNIGVTVIDVLGYDGQNSFPSPRSDSAPITQKEAIYQFVGFHNTKRLVIATYILP